MHATHRTRAPLRRIRLTLAAAMVACALVACSGGSSATRLPGVPLPGGSGSPAPSGSSSGGVPLPSSGASSFVVTGDEIQGWTWLRDAAGADAADWVFGGVPSGDTMGLSLELLATDTVNGGPHVDGQIWLSYGAMRGSSPGLAVFGPELVTIPNTSPASDPVGYTTTKQLSIAAAALSGDATGLWVHIGRRGPDGTTVGVHIAVRASTVAITGLLPALTASSFSVKGDVISGWTWMRDQAAANAADWVFTGTPTGARIGLVLELLATDTVNGRPRVAGPIWLSYGAMVGSEMSAAMFGPRLVTLPNTSAVDDPVGYFVSTTDWLATSELPAGATGLWVHIARSDPSGAPVSEHIAVRLQSVTVTGMLP